MIRNRSWSDPVQPLRDCNRPADLQQIAQFGEASLLQARENQRVIDKHRKLAFLLAGENLNLDGLNLFLQFRSETRCAGLVSSGSAILNFDHH